MSGLQKKELLEPFLGLDIQPSANFISDTTKKDHHSQPVY